jgi:hypothetical protein
MQMGGVHSGFLFLALPANTLPTTPFIFNLHRNFPDPRIASVRQQLVLAASKALFMGNTSLNP